MRLPLTLLALVPPLCCPAMPALAQSWRSDTDTCRMVTDAVLHGQVTAATDAFTPDDASDRLRRSVRALMQGLVDSTAAATDHLPPRLERVLPDFAVDGTPASLELWSFGDRQAYLVGCGIRPVGDTARISIQAYPTVEALAEHLRGELAGDPPP